MTDDIFGAFSRRTFVKTGVKYSGYALNFDTAGYAARSVPSTYR